MSPTMTKERAIELIKHQKEPIFELQRNERFCPEFKKWHRDTLVVIEKIFGESHMDEFGSLKFGLNYASNRTTAQEFQKAYLDGLTNASVMLDSLIQEIEQFWDYDTAAAKADSAQLLTQILSKFHVAARQLRVRHGGRPTLAIDDEYDVQDLLHALLKLHFDDIRKEEHTPSYAGGSSRMDFLLKNEQTVVEVKKTRTGLEQKEVGDQLIIDIQRYKAHQDCKQLVCFVYDPEGRIGNPTGLENDLSREDDGLRVQVVVYPK